MRINGTIEFEDGQTVEFDAATTSSNTIRSGDSAEHVAACSDFLHDLSELAIRHSGDMEAAVA
jgi:hypothetical protein